MVLETETLRRKAIVLFDAITAPAIKRVYLDPDFSDDFVVQVLGGDAKATNVLTLTANFADGDLVRIGTLSRGIKEYKAQTVLTDTDGNFLIGGTASISIDNLIAAILVASGAGALFASSTTKHPDVSAAAGAGDTLDATAIRKGVPSNSIATSETSATAAWTTATLLGGTAFTGTMDFRASQDDVEFSRIEAEGLFDGVGIASVTSAGLFRVKCGGLLVLLFDVMALSAGEITVLGYHRGLPRG